MRAQLFIAFVTTAAAASAAAFELPLAHDNVVKNEWRQQHQRLPPSTPHTITLVLHNNPSAVDRLSDLVAQVSTPSSSSYGKYWSLQQIADTFAPPSTTVDEIVAWARDALSPADVSVTLSRDFVTIRTTVGAIERALSCTMHSFQHKSRAITRIRTRNTVRLPPSIAAHVHVVLGLSDFLSPPRLRRIYDSLASPFLQVDNTANETAPSVGPRDVWAAYNIDYAGSPLSSVAVSAFEEQYGPVVSPHLFLQLGSKVHQRRRPGVFSVHARTPPELL
jgi:subtilase family serine protease